MLKMMIQHVSGSSVEMSFPGLKETKTGKLTIRLGRDAERKAIERAKAEKFPSRTTWATSLFLSVLNKTPVLNEEEVNLLRESNRELAAIGRNLNQVARALNIEFRESDRINRKAIESLANQIEMHRDKVAALLDKGMNRWFDDEA